MEGKLFLEGERPELEEVLETRENRVRFQHVLVENNPSKTVIAFKLNIPGPVKNNESIMKIFKIGLADLKETLKMEHICVHYEKVMDLNTGPEAYLVVDDNILKVKKLMLVLEDESLLGRLYDLDVFGYKDDKIITLSRGDLGIETRTCLICKRPAKECGRNRTHSVEEMHGKIEELISKEKRYE